ncbi:MAG: processive 1,2-diacylglycerol beta-glucosyltransferase [Thermoleophilaceae bacterium]|nr:processive 1,2-diacylglycerol beta-glucosyltransferase [Thermoleophilaceae bacterium]
MTQAAADERQLGDDAAGERPARPPRVLILTTDIGEGHDLPARQLEAAIREESPGAEVRIEDGLEHMGRILTGVLKDNSRAVFTAPPWLFDLQHWLAIRFKPTSALAQFFSVALGGRGLLGLVREYRPDIVVSTYPGCTLTLAPLRRRGYMRVPLVSAVTDLSQLRYWAWPGVDLHLITHPESEEEVRQIAGPTQVAWVRGLTSRGFTDPPDPEAGRRIFDLPEGVPVAVVSGGGWAVGDLASAVEVARSADVNVHVVVLCGRNDDVRKALELRFGHDPHVHVSGFTEHMNELFAAADVLIHSTAGLTVLEAYIRGCRVISYGWGIAHIKANNHAFERFGIARVAATREELAAALRDALEHPRADLSEIFAALPSAASAVLAAAPVSA